MTTNKRKTPKGAFFPEFMDTMYVVKVGELPAKLVILKGFFKILAEREGFEPPIALRLCLISSQVHSTGLCHLSALPLVYNN